MKSVKKASNVLLVLVLALGFCAIAPSIAMAEGGNAARGDLAAGVGAPLVDELAGGSGLSTQADGDYEADTWDKLQNAINNVEDGKTIHLVATSPPATTTTRWWSSATA